MQRGILEQMKEAEPIHKKHYMQSSKDKSLSAGMVFKKNSIGKSFAILSEAPQRSKTNSGEMTKPHTYQKRRSPSTVEGLTGFIILATTYSRTTAGSYYHRRLRA